MSISRSRLIFTLVGLAIPGLVLLAIFGPVPEVPDIDPTVLRLLTILQPLILVAVTAAIGAFTAPAVGLTTPVLTARAEGKSPLAILRANIRPAALVALLATAAGIVLDLGSRALRPGGLTIEPAFPSVPHLLYGMAYGGVVEEILIRWGLMSLFVWAGWKLFGRKGRPVASGFYWAGNLLAAVLFGLGHLPVAGLLGIPMTFATVAFIISANAIAGLLFGWLYWKKGLEVAMMAHALSHVVLFCVNLTLWAVLG